MRLLVSSLAVPPEAVVVVIFVLDSRLTNVLGHNRGGNLGGVRGITLFLPGDRSRNGWSVESSSRGGVKRKH